MKAPGERILYGEPQTDGSTPFWRMPTLWAAAAGAPIEEREISSLGVLDEVVWFGGPKDVRPTVRKVAERASDIMRADLNFPIIMTRGGDILDGAHRIARAYLEGKTHIRASVIDDWPPPDGVA
ncbi:MAG TPA: hypothetical protein PK264_15960 [Hyphomicrobiaceae bacterium]|nr:hypothetical protein [Hyphomicrobiaceae bacterium]